MRKRDGRVVASANCRDRQRVPRPAIARACSRISARPFTRSNRRAGDPLRRAAPLTPRRHTAPGSHFSISTSRASRSIRTIRRVVSPCGTDRRLRHPDRRPRRRCCGLSGDRSCCDQAPPSRPDPSRSELVRRRGALCELRCDGLDDSRAGRPDQAGRPGRGTADARAGFPDRHSRRPLGLHRRGLVGARPHAGRARPQQSPEHLRVRIAVSEYIMFEVVRCAATSCGGSASIGSGRPFRSASTRRKHGWLGVTTVTPAQWRVVLRHARTDGAARRSARCSWASTACSTWRRSRASSSRG